MRYKRRYKQHKRRYKQHKRKYNPLTKKYYGYKKQYNYYNSNYNNYKNRAKKNFFLRFYYNYKANKEYKLMQKMDFLMEGERQIYYSKTGKII